MSDVLTVKLQKLQELQAMGRRAQPLAKACHTRFVEANDATKKGVHPV